MISEVPVSSVLYNAKEFLISELFENPLWRQSVQLEVTLSIESIGQRAVAAELWDFKVGR
jgi:hypothetical protein